jgi:hypothetical protein
VTNKRKKPKTSTKKSERGGKKPPRKLLDCVAMKVMQPLGIHGIPGVVMLDERFTPYPKRGLQIENLCGMFATFVEIGMLRGLVVDTITPFGVQHMLYHVEGNITVDQGRAFFKACRSFTGIQELSQCLYLETPKNRVHMMVLTARLGKRVQVAKGGYMETSLAPHYSRFGITPRMDDDNYLRLDVTSYTGPLEIAPEIQPLTNDWTVTGRGAVIARFTWEALDWDAGVEARILAYSERVLALLEASC